MSMGCGIRQGAGPSIIKAHGRTPLLLGNLTEYKWRRIVAIGSRCLSNRQSQWIVSGIVPSKRGGKFADHAPISPGSAVRIQYVWGVVASRHCISKAGKSKFRDPVTMLTTALGCSKVQDFPVETSDTRQILERCDAECAHLRREPDAPRFITSNFMMLVDQI